MIQILWPTIRPEKMLKTLARWLKDASGKHAISLSFAVNTAEDFEAVYFIHSHKDKSYDELNSTRGIISGVDKPGPVWPVYILGQDLIKNSCRANDDIVIVISDDFFGFKDWDEYLVSELSGKTTGLMVSDGYQGREGRAMTLPIMTFGALKALNGIIYHPDYHWQFCDNELFENLTALGMLKEARDGGPTFRHEHWITGHRQKDAHDLFGDEKSATDRATFERRMKLPLERRLLVADAGDVLDYPNKESITRTYIYGENKF